ncbi:hypothetical protein [Sulfuracidifex tepidarius]|uniref:Uncharacterized protein n=1 Tax=Sulfuracidifex tepidarius TaxID=1294262 RepID=A0A510E1R0_9CREN|nr:hypothetical protein [Sulfuracidifex tepidarius]BBG23660.1 hypothetical protein IC006_0948 [Sulfuracidifex tepidarius]BBG26407.1 hypothetical protein IC007_0915 [Sulfuracidifex tepidarius]
MKSLAEKLKEKGYNAEEIKVRKVQIDREDETFEMKPLYSLEIEIQGRKVLALVGRLKKH